MVKHIMLLAALCFCASAFAQRFTATVDRDKILIGEQFTLELKISGLTAGQHTVLRWFELADTVNHLEVVQREKPDTIDMAGSLQYVQRIVMTSFDSGSWRIPALSIAVQDAQAIKPRLLTTEPITIDVLPVDVSHMQDYHDIKEIIPVRYWNPEWIYWALGALLLLLLLFLLWRWWKKRRKNRPKGAGDRKTALARALQSIEALEAEHRSGGLGVKAFYTQLDAIYRLYLQDAHGLHSSRLTPDELMVKTGPLFPREQERTRFYQLLRLTAAVRFARFQPGPHTAAQALADTRDTLTYLDGLQKETQHDS